MRGILRAHGVTIHGQTNRLCIEPSTGQRQPTATGSGRQRFAVGPGAAGHADAAAYLSVLMLCSCSCHIFPMSPSAMCDAPWLGSSEGADPIEAFEIPRKNPAFSRTVECAEFRLGAASCFSRRADAWRCFVEACFPIALLRPTRREIGQQLYARARAPHAVCGTGAIVPYTVELRSPARFYVSLVPGDRVRLAEHAEHVQLLYVRLATPRTESLSRCDGRPRRVGLRAAPAASHRASAPTLAAP